MNNSLDDLVNVVWDIQASTISLVNLAENALDFRDLGQDTDHIKQTIQAEIAELKTRLMKAGETEQGKQLNGGDE